MQGKISPSLPVPSYLSNQVHSHNRPFQFGSLDGRSGLGWGGGTVTGSPHGGQPSPPGWLLSTSLYLNPSSPLPSSPFISGAKSSPLFGLSKHFKEPLLLPGQFKRQCHHVVTSHQLPRSRTQRSVTDTCCKFRGPGLAHF